MRIGLITGEYPPMQGGVGAFTREIAREMVRQDHEVHVLTRKGAAPSNDGVIVSATIGKTWGWHTLSVAADWARRAKLELVNIQFQTAAYDMHPSVHFLPSYFRHMPVIVTFHDLRVPYLFPKAGAIRSWIVKYLATSSSAVIATDRADAAVLAEQWGINKVCWVPIGSNIRTTPPDSYDRTQWRSRLGIGKNDLLISYFGFLNESKGAVTLINALAHLVNHGVSAHVIMIGGRAGASDPTDFAYGQQVDAAIAAADLGDRVHWSGFVEDDQVSAHFYASDVTALPYNDGVSLRRGTLMAALAHQRAIVTTIPKSPVPELENAVVTVAENDPFALAQAIRNLWLDEPQRTALQLAAKNTAAHFTWDTITRNTIEFFTSVVNQ